MPAGPPVRGACHPPRPHPRGVGTPFRGRGRGRAQARGAPHCALRVCFPPRGVFCSVERRHFLALGMRRVPAPSRLVQAGCVVGGTERARACAPCSRRVCASSRAALARREGGVPCRHCFRLVCAHSSRCERALWRGEGRGGAGARRACAPCSRSVCARRHRCAPTSPRESAARTWPLKGSRVRRPRQCALAPARLHRPRLPCAPARSAPHDARAHLVQSVRGRWPVSFSLGETRPAVANPFSLARASLDRAQKAPDCSRRAPELHIAACLCSDDECVCAQLQRCKTETIHPRSHASPGAKCCSCSCLSASSCAVAISSIHAALPRGRVPAAVRRKRQR